MTQALSVYSPQLPITDLDAYIARVNRIPLLSDTQEKDLARALREEGDLKAAQTLVLSHLRYVVRIAKGYLGYGLPLSDLVQEGTIGLMKAVRRFDPEQGVRLVSFAVHWIKAEIHDFILKNWRIVKVATTKAQRKLFFNLRKFKQRLGWFSQAEIEAVAEDLGVKPSDVLKMEARLNAKDLFLDAPQDTESGNLDKSSVTQLEMPNSNPANLLEEGDWEARSTQALSLAMQRLDERSQDIIRQRWLLESAEQKSPSILALSAPAPENTKAKLKALADKYGLSAERIRQIEQAALKKMKSWIEAELNR